MKNLILISGLPATGKTTLARKLSKHLSAPLFCKDDLKESLYESSGSEWLRTQEAGIAIEDLLWSLAQTTLLGSDRVILESTFRQDYTRLQYEKLMQSFPGLTSINVWCRADEEERRDTIERRSVKRSRVHEKAREIGPDDSAGETMRLGYCDSVMEYRVGMEIDEVVKLLV